VVAVTVPIAAWASDTEHGLLSTMTVSGSADSTGAPVESKKFTVMMWVAPLARLVESR
jgi:hypothetical protein